MVSALTGRGKGAVTAYEKAGQQTQARIASCIPAYESIQVRDHRGSTLGPDAG